MNHRRRQCRAGGYATFRVDLLDARPRFRPVDRTFRVDLYNEG